MAGAVILRPSWPEIYTNLTLSRFERTPKDHSICGLHVIICFLIVVLFNHFRRHIALGSKLPLALLCSTLGIASSPLLILILILFGVYRLLVRAVLATQCPGYRGLVDGADAYWCLEEDNSRAVINILAFVELTSQNNDQDLRCVLKNIFEKRILSDAQLFKLKCLRKFSSFGYPYWDELKDLNLDEHIRWMDLDTVTEESVTNYVSDNSNQYLPHNHMSLWEVLVGRHPLTRDGRHLHPVLFRIHHACGDGIALVSLFINSFTDNGSGPTYVTPLQRIREKRRNAITQDFEGIEDQFDKPYSKRKNSLFNDEMRKLNKHCMYGISNLLQNISVLLFTPYVLISQASSGVDKSILHGKELVGKKYVARASGVNTFAKVKFIKNKLKCHVTDVVLYALSNVFEGHFSRYGKPPEDLTLVIPARVSFEDVVSRSRAPSNGFTVGMIKLPIAASDKVQAVRRAADRLRLHPDYLVNYWLLKVVCNYLPIALLRSAMKSKQASAALSNIPGPDSLSKIEGNIIQDLVFWTTNRDTTGVGISLLSYAGKLTFGLIVDRALIPDQEDVKNMARGIVDEIDKMYDCIKDKHG